jgi:hypothetical protein
MYSLFLYIFAQHVSGGIYTHPQEHKLESTAIRMCSGNEFDGFHPVVHRHHK